MKSSKNENNKENNAADKLEQKLKSAKIGETSSPSKLAHTHCHHATESHGFKLTNDNSPKTSPQPQHVFSPKKTTD